MSQFDDNHYAEDETESSPAPSTFTDKVVNTYTADSGDYVMLGSISYRSNSTTRSVGIDFQTEGISRQQVLVEHRNANDYESAFFMTKQTLSAGSKTDCIKWMGENSDPRVKSARLISCKLPSLTQTVEVEFTGTSNTQDWTQLDWTSDLSFTTTGVATKLQLYNYDASQYPTSGDGYLADTIGQTDITKTQTITIAPADFRGDNGNWKIKVTGTKATAMQFELKMDWVEFKATTSDVYRLNISNNFALDLSTYPRDWIQGIEVLIRYNVTEDAERWFLKAYNWATASFSDTGFNITTGSQPTLGEWNEYAIAVTEYYADYVNDEGMVRLEFFDGVGPNQTAVGVDFLAVRAIIDGTRFDLKNSSPLSIHIVALWIINSTNHQRYSADFFMNAGETATYLRVDIKMPQEFLLAKVATERGNIAVFSEG
jgi:hypothetical protein